MEIFQRLLTWWHGRDIERRIRRYGWTAIYVGDYHSAPTWTYTLGLSQVLNGPELLVFDVTQEMANTIFWDVYEDLKSGALKIEDGLAWPPESERPVVFRKVLPDLADEWLPLAAQRHAARWGRHSGLEAFQMVLSDPDGRYPWQSGYDERLRERQPVLYERGPVMADHP